ncbi:uncharacterized protein Z519_05240 [Cladophialophora bantiana CBS 173.52]|uniref:TLC domain-containing protein n=1 Tax=Cladophialophora bantiana (strain ATCC 10958 / CBS 173.52 / CDC B-1940 / NIH 8579) TaxID=1442370 RepID=A0A0D2HSS4_CLAB1|nr:uncharacterized protein Z519_05240 [Cladophialophora bantiana CBS 173.52]KIW93925.1 hypothetical protein Z519_05240 [Cladophialophora bantiana CBS 173.52]
MLDPLPPPPPRAVSLVKPFSEALHLPSLPYHIHEVVGAFILYQTTQSIISPVLSNLLFPNIYPKLTRRTRVNWDVHVVSLLQSCVINAAALWVMFKDQERKDMQRSAIERIYGYTGASGLIQGLATGYFVWDLVVSARYIKIFGPGILAHAITALSVFALGFRPFCNYYGPVFILYELSTPFLNIHWFCDKLNMTGSQLQWYNGMILLSVFFGCRLIWGTYQSLRVYQDVWHTMHLNIPTGPVLREIPSSPHSSIFVPRDGQLCLGDKSCIVAQSEVMQFTGPHSKAVPFWLAGVYLTCNLVLNSLNFYWFGKMIEAVLKRFEGKPHEDFPRERERQRKQSIVEAAATELDYETLSGPKSADEENEETEEPADLGKSTALSDGSAEARKR